MTSDAGTRPPTQARSGAAGDPSPAGRHPSAVAWRRRSRHRAAADTQPAYVGSWVYVFGVVTIAALFWVVLSGVVLAFFGSEWWHVSSVGHFFNSIHFWSVQMFFIFMVLHLWGQFWGAGWRDGRAKTLDGRRRDLLDQRRHRVHRIRHPAELRLAVDRDQCQGRDQLDRRSAACSTRSTSDRCTACT